MPDANDALAAAAVNEAQRVLRINLKKIRHCLDQLSDEHVNWRPFEQQNSIANVILHLCGNVRQWIITGIGNEPDRRNREAEFADRRSYRRGDLLDRLEKTVAEADTVLSRLTTADDLLGPRKVQGFDETALSAMLHVAAHFEGHTHEIVYITRLLIRDKYKFHFVPSDKVRGSV